MAVRGSSVALWEEALRIESSQAALLTHPLYWFSIAAEWPKKTQIYDLTVLGIRSPKIKVLTGLHSFRSFRGEFHPLPCLFQLTYIPWLMAPSFIFRALTSAHTSLPSDFDTPALFFLVWTLVITLGPPE